MTTKYWVFDTNILFSALINEHGIPARALQKARTKGRIVISSAVASEYTEVFNRPKFNKYIPIEIRTIFIENIMSRALFVNIKEVIRACRDPKDDMFLELAVASGASCIVTGDKALLELDPFRDIRILSAADFMTLF